MRKIYLIFPLLFTLLTVACDDDAEIVRLTNEDPVLSVSSISPQRGYAGAEVTIEGANFGAAKELVKVFFTGMEESAELLTCEDTKLVVKVPENAASGALTIEANKMRIVTSDRLFTVIPNPEMMGISPARVTGNAEVTIIGKNFGTVTEDVQLYCMIDGEEVPFTITSCMDEEIKAIVPETTVFGEFDLKVRIQGKEAKNVLKITLLEKPTVTTVKSDNVLSESFAFAGDKVTISGTGFGTDANAVTVKFGDLNAVSIESCANSEIIAVVPDGFAGGAITVTKDGLSSTSADELKVLEDNTDISSYVLKNYKAPFTPNEFKEGQGGTENSWAVPAGWTVNEAAQNMFNKQNGLYCSVPVGGLNTDAQVLIIQAGWNNNAVAATKTVTNGKMYQNITLPKGSYMLKVTYGEVVLKTGNPYVAIVKNMAELPNPDQLSEANGDVFWKFKDHSKNAPLAEESIPFNLSETTEICLGFTANLPYTSCFKVTEFKLVYVGDVQ